MIGQNRLVCIAAVMWIASATGFGTARADDVQVNTYTTGDQQIASVAMDADGDFVVVWASEGSGGTDSDGSSIQSQRYTSDGSAAGGELQVNTYATSDQDGPSVAMDADGDFVVVWISEGSGGTDSSSFSIQSQRYASDGSTTGGELQVNTYTTFFQRTPSVAMDADGDFVVVWQNLGSDVPDAEFRTIQGQRFASDGNTAGGEFQVNTYYTFFQDSPRVAMDADGDFVVVWSSDGSGGTDTFVSSIQGRLYASNGSPVGGQFQVNTYTPEGQLAPSVTMAAGGDFVVAWRSTFLGPYGFDLSIQAQRYAAGGAPAGGELQVSTHTTNDQHSPALAAEADGDFMVVWLRRSDALASGRILGRRYHSDGSTAGGAFKVDTNDLLFELLRRPAVAMAADGDFVVAWESSESAGTDTDGYSIQKTPATLIFADGFESGDTDAWSAAIRSPS